MAIGYNVQIHVPGSIMFTENNSASKNASPETGPETFQHPRKYTLSTQRLNKVRFRGRLVCPPESVLPVFVDSTSSADNASAIGASLARLGCPFVRLGGEQRGGFTLNQKAG